jgi:3-oxoacyl-[acyl-carrier protein] reductase
MPVMEAQGGGTIINISSGAAYNALEGWSHYCSSKAAALMLTRCAVHKEYGTARASAVAVSVPGTVATDMQVCHQGIGHQSGEPAGSIGRAHSGRTGSARPVVWLAREGADEFAGRGLFPEVR